MDNVYVTRLFEYLNDFFEFHVPNNKNIVRILEKLKNNTKITNNGTEYTYAIGNIDLGYAFNDIETEFFKIDSKTYDLATKYVINNFEMLSKCNNININGLCIEYMVGAKYDIDSMSYVYRFIFQVS